MSAILAAGMPGMWEILVILAVFLLFFGSSRLPKMARSLGSSLTEFKKGLRGEPDDEERKNLPDTGADSADSPSKGEASASKGEDRSAQA